MSEAAGRPGSSRTLALLDSLVAAAETAADRAAREAVERWPVDALQALASEHADDAASQEAITAVWRRVGSALAALP